MASAVPLRRLVSFGFDNCVRLGDTYVTLAYVCVGGEMVPPASSGILPLRQLLRQLCAPVACHSNGGAVRISERSLRV